MLITNSEKEFLSFVADHGTLLERMRPQDLVLLGCAFYEAVRATDARPVSEEFADALLFQWGTQERIPGYCDAYFFIDLTRQFISVDGCDDDAIFQLSCQLQYQLSDVLLKVGSGNRWCPQLSDLSESRQFMFAHPALAAVANDVPTAVKLSFGGV